MQPSKVREQRNIVLAKASRMISIAAKTVRERESEVGMERKRERKRKRERELAAKAYASFSHEAVGVIKRVHTLTCLHTFATCLSIYFLCLVLLLQSCTCGSSPLIYSICTCDARDTFCNAGMRSVGKRQKTLYTWMLFVYIHTHTHTHT